MSTLSTGVAGAALRNAAADEAARTAVRVLEPRSGWVAIGWGELWEYRELLGFLVWRDVKVRYKQTVLGAAWAILQPLMTMVMFTLLFGRWAKMPSDGLPYQVFAFAALLPWTFFSNAVSSAAASLVGNTHLISKVYFPRLLIAMASIGTGLVDFAVALGVMLVLLVYYRVGLTWNLAAIPLLSVLMLMISFGVGSLLAALCGMYRDVRYLVPPLMQLWMFGSPVIYSVTLVPARWRWLFYLNPLVGVIDGFRSALLGLPFNWPSIGLSAIVGLFSLWIGFAYFRSVERRVADLL
jgi:lipopolysaccharide transport system permease protein